MIINELSSNRWAVNGTPIYNPSSVAIANDNIVSSDTGRTESGYMYITWVRTTVRTVKLTYEWITGTEVAFLHSLMQGREFSFTYYDNGVKTMSAYAGKDSYTLCDPSLYANEGGLYKNYSIDIIEM